MKQNPADFESKRYLIVINNLTFFYSHFWNLAVAVRDAGWEVYVAATENADPNRVSKNGMKFIALPPVGGLKKMGRGPRYFLALVRELRILRPTVTHFVYLENVLFGSIASRVVRSPAVIGAITGLGSLFAEDRTHYKVARRLVMGAIQYGFKGRNAVLAFENPDDKRFFVDRRVIDERKTSLIPGAGVDRDEILASNVVNSRPIILFASRMIRNKGVLELVRAAQELNKRGLDFELWLVGDVDSNNPSSLTKEELQQIGLLSFVKYFGFREDAAQLMRRVDVVCLPTYYREGLPRVLIEACAAGRAIVTTDVPGCREIVLDNINGILVPPQNHEALVRSLEGLLRNPEVRTSMGKRARFIFEERFTLDAFFVAFNQCYRLLGIKLVLK